MKNIYIDLILNENDEDVTEHPITETPSTTITTITTSVPTTTITTITTLVPTTTESPSTTESPTTTAVPTTTESPTTAVPTTTESPSTTESPTTTESPSTTQLLREIFLQGPAGGYGDSIENSDYNNYRGGGGAGGIIINANASILKQNGINIVNTAITEDGKVIYEDGTTTYKEGIKVKNNISNTKGLIYPVNLTGISEPENSLIISRKKWYRVWFRRRWWCISL